MVHKIVCCEAQKCLFFSELEQKEFFCWYRLLYLKLHIVFYSIQSMRYRSRTEIVSMILEAGNGGATKTRIMYKAFLSFAQLKEYLSLLVENNLLEYLEGAKIYKTTEKGLNFLKMHNEISELLQTTIRVKNSIK